jgi:hypothetical protein
VTRVHHLLGPALLFVAACAGPSAPSDPHPSPTTSAAPTAAAPSASAAATAAADAGAGAQTEGGPAADAAADAGADAAADASAAAAAVPFVKDNKVLPPLESEELTARARGLFEAIVNDDPARGEPFWFPKEPFIPLKDVKGPDKYWDNLHRTFERDVHALHKKRKSWEGATFESFEVGSTPKWVPPGDEANKIGYYRSFRGKLRYRIEGKPSTIEVHTIISWQGKWYITHLSKFKKK